MIYHPRPFPVAIATLVVHLMSAGCVSVGTPREISVNTEVGSHEPVDASQVPPTKDHAEARQRLAEAYAEIRSLRSDVDKLERDKKDIKRERDEYKKERDDCRKQTKRDQKADKKARKEAGD